MPISRYRRGTMPPAPPLGAPLSRELDAIETLGRSLEAVPLLDGELIEGIAYAGTAITRAHGLQRKWSGYLVTKIDATETVSALEADNPENSKGAQITVTASGNATFNLWVF